MLGLRYVACPRCETVYSVPDDPDECDRCGAPGLETLASGPAAAAYFSRGLGGGPD